MLGDARGQLSYRIGKRRGLNTKDAHHKPEFSIAITQQRLRTTKLDGCYSGNFQGACSPVSLVFISCWRF